MVKSDDLKDEMVIPSLLAKRGIRYNKYPNGKVRDKSSFLKGQQHLLIAHTIVSPFPSCVL